MSLSLLFADELNGFYRSRVMIFLWIGLPALAILLYIASPDTEGVPLSSFTSIIIGAIGGLVTSAMLAVSIINERERHVYDLFVIRPVRRRDILLSKFMGVYVSVAIAGILALGLGLVVDFGISADSYVFQFESVVGALILMLSTMAITCSTGVLIGVISPSVLVGVILVMYGANQLSAVAMLPVLLMSSEILFPLIPGVAISAVMLFLAILLFNRKQL